MAVNETHDSDEERDLSGIFRAYQIALLSGDVVGAVKILSEYPEHLDSFKTFGRTRHIDIEYVAPVRKYLDVSASREL